VGGAPRSTWSSTRSWTWYRRNEPPPHPQPP